MFQKLLRIYSYLFAIVSSLGYLGFGLISKILGQPLVMDNMPWKGEELSNWLLGTGVLGLVGTAAAVTGSRLRILLPIYSFIALYITIKGNFLGTHSFDGAPDFQKTLAISASAVVAALASLLQLKLKSPIGFSKAPRKTTAAA